MPAARHLPALTAGVCWLFGMVLRVSKANAFVGVATAKPKTGQKQTQNWRCIRFRVDDIGCHGGLAACGNCWHPVHPGCLHACAGACWTPITMRLWPGFFSNPQSRGRNGVWGCPLKGANPYPLRYGPDGVFYCRIAAYRPHAVRKALSRG